MLKNNFSKFFQLCYFVQYYFANYEKYDLNIVDKKAKVSFLQQLLLHLC